MKTIQDAIRQFGPVDSWLLPAAEIERIIRTGTCRHLLSRIDACRECFASALLRRQMAVLAERLGLSCEDAAEVGDRLTRQHLGDR